MNKKLIFWGLSLFVFCLYASLASSYNLGAIIPMLLGLLMLLYGRYFAAVRRRVPRRARRAVYLVFAFVLALWFSWQAVATVWMFSERDGARDFAPDAIVVLGAGFWGDRLSTVLKARLDTALTLSRAYPEAYVVVSGGKTFGEFLAEAEIMAGYLDMMGVPPEKIIREENASVTSENFRFSKALMDSRFGRGNWRAVFVTSEFHLFRSRVLAEKAGFPGPGVSSATDPLLLPSFVVREALAIAQMLLSGA